MGRALRETMNELSRDNEGALQADLGAWRALGMLRARPAELLDLVAPGLRKEGWILQPRIWLYGV